MEAFEVISNKTSTKTRHFKKTGAVNVAYVLNIF